MIAKIKIEYKGKVISLNQYKSLHWRSLKQKTDPLKLVFNALITKAAPPPLKWLELRIYHNTRLDLDNISGTIKIFVDCLRHKNIIEEDNKRFWDYLSIQYNPELKKGVLIFELTGETK